MNLRGTWHCLKYELAQMLSQGGGTIVNCASVGGLVGVPGMPLYAATKHGVVGLTKTAALEYATQGIRVNAVCPGFVQTAMADRVTGGRPEVHDQLLSAQPNGRLGEPEEIASAVLWLSSPGESFVTGAALAVDGGWSAQ
ncbi:SDR family oxidoreductase [Nocardia nova]|uniref:SDR family oxidoreductase n=1 Tax=Nocardia nova TaxID=37330 RepID=UPI003F540226